MVGASLGIPVGLWLGSLLGTELGLWLGVALGAVEGASLGIPLGTLLGLRLGTELGPWLGTLEGESLGMQWPDGVISLSHVALPFPADDPIYGAGPPPSEDTIFLGESNIRGERNLLRIPASLLIRLRHNPFFPYLERRTLDWIERANRNPER